MRTEITCIILAAGKSSRMNFQKALLQFNQSEKFLTHIIEVYKSANIQSVVVASSELKKEIRNSDVLIVVNDEPEKGRMHSIKKGLEAANDFDFCLIQNVDNPFVNKELIEQLIQKKKSDGSTSPVYNGNTGHPVLISKEIIRYINSLPYEDTNLREVLNKFPKTKVKTDDAKVLVNINTMEVYERWFGTDKSK